jgi:hypothetical protein
MLGFEGLGEFALSSLDDPGIPVSTTTIRFMLMGVGP